MEKDGEAKLSLILILVFFISISIFVIADLNCTISTTGSCDNNYTALLYIENDSGGATNAHAQLINYSTYNNVLCCNSSNQNITTDCGTKFLILSNETNAHVQDPNNTDFTQYSYDACIDGTSDDFTCNISINSCASDYTCLASIASDNQTTNRTSAHVGFCSAYDTLICCSLNSPPGTPNLLTPEDGNNTLTNRTPTFTWGAVTDPESDAVTYNLEIDGSSDFSSVEVDGRNITGISGASYVLTDELASVDSVYYWRVIAFDGQAYSSYSSIFNFTVKSTVIISLPTNSIDFGVLALGQSNNTDSGPSPITVQNDGNYEADVNISVENDLWDTILSPSLYFQYKFDNVSGEEGAFNWSASIIDWTNVPITNNTALKQLNYSDANDIAQLDLNVTVPLDEPAGNKSALIVITGMVSG